MSSVCKAALTAHVSVHMSADEILRMGLCWSVWTPCLPFYWAVTVVYTLWTHKSMFVCLLRCSSCRFTLRPRRRRRTPDCLQATFRKSWRGETHVTQLLLWLTHSSECISTCFWKLPSAISHTKLKHVWSSKLKGITETTEHMTKTAYFLHPVSCRTVQVSWAFIWDPDISHQAV